MFDFTYKEPSAVRDLISKGDININTAGMCHGYAQGNLVILPRALASEFLEFTKRNPKSCPVLEVTDVGSKKLIKTAGGDDITKVFPRYRIYEKGVLQSEHKDISEFWREDFVGFILGCSFTFESALIDAGIKMRHIENQKNVSMYITNVKCEPYGSFSGPMVVSMRPIKKHLVEQVIEITSKYPKVHGAPVHIGVPSEIGISDINTPDFGDPVEIMEDEVAVFWACGVTPQAVAMEVKPEIMITHGPGHMLITDIKNEDLEDF